VRIRLTIDITRTPKPTPDNPETFESNGSLVEQIGQPRYAGFTPEPSNNHTRARRSV
jgi:hypothetical protein